VVVVVGLVVFVVDLGVVVVVLGGVVVGFGDVLGEVSNCRRSALTSPVKLILLLFKKKKFTSKFVFYE
jgi:hypothetical protein